MTPERAIGPRTSIVWGVQKRRALLWFGAAAVGAWCGHALPLPTWMWMPMAAISLVVLWAWRRKRDAMRGPLLLVVIALAAALATAARVAEYERWEAHYPRGERRTMRARVVDVLPHTERSYRSPRGGSRHRGGLRNRLALGAHRRADRRPLGGDRRITARRGWCDRVARPGVSILPPRQPR